MGQLEGDKAQELFEIVVVEEDSPVDIVGVEGHSLEVDIVDFVALGNLQVAGIEEEEGSHTLHPQEGRRIE